METPRAPTWGLFMGEKVVHESGQRRERKEKKNGIKRNINSLLIQVYEKWTYKVSS
jgi:hypothetical protein